MKLTPLTCLFLWLGVWIAGVSGSAWALENGSPAEGKAPPAVKVEGYRSARFGMTEKEVVDAISKDFHLGPISIKTKDHPIQKTRHLEILEDEALLPNSGPARIFYILGYKSKRLMQVNVLWSQAIEAGSATHALVDNANLLRKYFLSQGFKKESIVVNQKLKGGIIMVFRGLDGEGRSSELILIPSKQKKSPSSKPSALTLRLSYKQNPSHPDIFHLPKGKF